MTFLSFGTLWDSVIQSKVLKCPLFQISIKNVDGLIELKITEFIHYKKKEEEKKKNKKPNRSITCFFITHL
jgi:hypothetical protein